MLPSIFASTKHVEDLGADSLSTADQEKQLLIEREQDQDSHQDQDGPQDQHQDKESGVPQLDKTKQRKRRAMASARRVMVALLVCCFMALGLASTGIIQPCHHDEAGTAEQAAIEGQPSRLSSLLGGNDVRALLERFSSHALGQLGKRQADNATTTATSVTTAATTVLSSSTVATVTASSSSEPASSSSASSAPTTSAVQTTQTSPTSAATTTVVQTTTQAVTETSQAATTTVTPTPTLSPTSAASSAPTTTAKDTTLTTQTSSTKTSQSTNKATTSAASSSSPSSTLVTATLTSTLPDGGVSVVTMTSYSYVNAAGATGTSTTPNASLQTDNAAAQGKLLTPGLAVAGAGLWLLQYL